MSSGSSGVMKVWFSRVKISWMISSPWCSSLDDLLGDFGEPRIAGLDALQQQTGCLGNHFHLLAEQG